MSYNPGAFICSCPISTTFDLKYTTAAILHGTDGYCYCPQGTLSTNQYNLIWVALRFRCECPAPGVPVSTLNSSSEIRLTYNYASQVCECPLPTTGLVAGEFALVFTSDTRRTCKCPSNLILKNSASYVCACNADSATYTTYQAPLTYSSGTCVCPDITVWSTSSAHCECPNNIASGETRATWSGSACVCNSGTLQADGGCL